jgi:hypothetical protein
VALTGTAATVTDSWDVDEEGADEDEEEDEEEDTDEEGADEDEEEDEDEDNWQRRGTNVAKDKVHVRTKDWMDTLIRVQSWSSTMPKFRASSHWSHWYN